MTNDADYYIPVPHDAAQICERITIMLGWREWSWTYLSERTGIDDRTFRRWKNGEVVPLVGLVREVARAVNLTYEELTDDLPERPAKRAPRAKPFPRQEEAYDPWKPAIGRQLFGRKATLQALKEALEQRRSVNLVGDRRIGKTSVLKTWEREARALGYPVVWVSGETMSGRTARALVQAITGTPAPEDPDGAADALQDWIAATAHTGRPPLVLVDEFDEVVLHTENRFFQRLRGMVGAEAVTLVVATCRHLHELSAPGHTSPFENLLESQPLGLLDPEAAEQLAGHRALAPADTEALRFWSGRHPFYLKLLARRLVAARGGGQTNDAAIEAFRVDAGPALDAAWHRHSLQEQDALRDLGCAALAHEGAASGARAPGSAMSAKAIRRLRQRGVLTEEGKPFGEVLTRWIAELTPPPD